MTTDETTEILWDTCRRISIADDVLSWELAQRRYRILEAYKDGPHRELMAADNDDLLRAFLRKWGPLRQAARRRDSLTWYRNKRELFTATVQLLYALDNSSEIQSILLRLLRASDEHDPLSLFIQLSPRFQSLGEGVNWCQTAPQDELRLFCMEFVNDFPFSCGPRFVVQMHRRNITVRASLFINNLVEGLWWMVWQDVFRSAPFYFCLECGRLILREGKRRWKYCDGACAKKHADTASWRRKHGKNIRYRKGGLA